MVNYCLDYYLEDKASPKIVELFSEAYVTKIFLSTLKKLAIDYYCELAIFWVDEERALALNKEYRGKDYVPDVLSFPLDDILYLQTKERVLGDIFLNFAEMQRKTLTKKNEIQNEGVWCIVHGLLHLFGYDHEKDENDEKIMFALTEEIMKEFGLTYNL